MLVRECSPRSTDHQHHSARPSAEVSFFEHREVVSLAFVAPHSACWWLDTTDPGPYLEGQEQTL